MGLDDEYKDLFYYVEQNRAKKIENALSDEDLNLNVNFKFEHGCTALHLAVACAHKDAVDILLTYGADVTIRNCDGKSSLDLIKDQLEAKPNDDNLKQINISLEKGRSESTSDKAITPNDDGKSDQRNQAPGPSTVTKQQTTKNIFRSTENSIHGLIFQLRLIMFFAQRARKMGYKFRLASEMDEAEKFDDVVIEHIVDNEKRWSFVQAKHKLGDDVKIKMSELLNSAQFSIPKYFLSFIKITMNFDSKYGAVRLKDFAIVTNATFESENFMVKDDQTQKWFRILEKATLDQDDILYLEKVEKYQLCDNDFILKLVIKRNLLVSPKSAKILKQIDKFPAVQSELERRAEEISKKIRRSGDSSAKRWNAKNQETDGDQSDYSEKCVEEMEAIDNSLAEKWSAEKEKIECDQSNVDSLREDRDKLSRRVREANDLREYIQNFTDMTALQNDAHVKEFCGDEDIDLSKMKSVNFLHKALSEIISQLSIIEVALDDAAFEKYFDEFVKKFQFVSNFPNEKKLDSLNKTLLLGDHYKLSNVNLVNSSFVDRILELMNSKEGENHFYTPQFEDEISNAIDGLLVSGLSMAHCGDIKSNEIRFDEKSSRFSKLSSILNEFLIKEQQKCHERSVVNLRTQSTRASSIKVLQILENHQAYNNKDSFIFIRLKKLSRSHEMRKSIFDTFKNSESHNLLVIDCEDEKTLCSIDEQLKDIRDESINKSKQKKRKRIILISKRLNLYDVGLVHLNIEDSTSFEDLDENSQSAVLETEVNFQGIIINLSRLIDTKFGIEFFDETSLTRLLNEDKMVIGNDSAFCPKSFIEDYYVERTFHRDILKKEILENEDQLFFITLTKKEEDIDPLDDFADPSEEDLKAHLLRLEVPEERIFRWHDGGTHDRKWTKGIVIPSTNSNCFAKNLEIFQNLGENVHWLELHRCWFESYLFWKMSTADVSLVIQNVDKESDQKHYNILDEHHFSNVDSAEQRLFLIANEPGMGKSTVLTSVARKMNALNSDGNNIEVEWIVRINLSKCAKYVCNYTFTDQDTDEAIELVTKMAIPDYLSTDTEIRIQRKLFELSLKRGNGVSVKKPKVVLMFDGFDEICPDYELKTSNLIKALQKSDAAQIWITTRAHEKDHLQKELRSLAYTLNPFNKQNQERFLDKFWKWRLKEKLLDDPQVLNSFNITTKSTGNISKSLEELQRDIDALDLSRQMINVYKWMSLVFEREKFTTVPLLLRMLADVAMEMKFVLPSKNVLFNLYDKFIEIKFNIYFEEKKNNFTATQFTKDSLQKVFNGVAVDLIFPNNKSLPGRQILERLGDNTQEMVDLRKCLTVTGVLILKAHRLTFIHRSFAEYFFSRYLIENLSDPQVQDLLIDKILVYDDYGLICEFFNDQIVKHPEEEIKLTDSVLREANQNGFAFFPNIINKSYHGICEIFLKSICCYTDMCWMILKKSLRQTNVGGQNFLHRAFIKRDMSIIDTILSFIQRYPDIRKELLLQSDIHGKRPLCRLFDEKFIRSQNYVQMCNTINALMEGIDDQFFEDLALFTVFSCHIHDIPGHIDTLLECTVKSMPKFFKIVKMIKTNFDDIKQKREELVKDINLNSGITQNVLYKSKGIHNQMFEIKQVLLSVDNHGTVLHQAIKNGRNNVMKQIFDNVIQIFSTKFTSEFLSKREYKSGGTALHSAVERGHEDYVELLIERGANINAKDNAGLTPLHAAIRCRDKKVVQLLIEKGADVNIADAGECTPLHTACWKGYKDIVEILVQNGANIHCRNSYNFRLQLTRLAYFADVTEEVAELFREIGANGDAEDVGGWTPLHITAIYGFKEIAKLLIEKGADVNVKNHAGWTPLRAAVTSGKMEVAELLIRIGADVNIADSKGRTPLRVATENNHTKIAQFLIENGADTSSLH